MPSPDDMAIAPLVRPAAKKRGASADEGPIRSKTKSSKKKALIPVGNIMTDPRVWRGPTYNLYSKPKQEIPKPIVAPLRRAGNQTADQRIKRQPATPESSQCRYSGQGDVLTLVLEEITDVPLEVDKLYRYELAKVRPNTPPFRAATTSKDATTDIKHNDLFIFDREVKPLLEILIGQTVEQALLEVAQEEEDIVKAQEHALAREYRNVLSAEEQRLSAQRQRYQEEEQRRLDESAICEDQIEDAAQRSRRAAFAREYIEALMPSVFHKLHKEGYFANRVRREIEQHFVPWIHKNVGTALDDWTAASLVAQVLLRKTLLESLEELSTSMHMARHPAQEPITFQLIHPNLTVPRHHKHKHDIPAITLTEDSISQ